MQLVLTYTYLATESNLPIFNFSLFFKEITISISPNTPKQFGKQDVEFPRGKPWQQTSGRASNGSVWRAVWGHTRQKSAVGGPHPEEGGLPGLRHRADLSGFNEARFSSMQRERGAQGRASSQRAVTLVTNATVLWRLPICQGHWRLEFLKWTACHLEQDDVSRW